MLEVLLGDLEMLKKQKSGIKNKIILAAGAHFDDVETGVGGTLLKHIKNGDTVKIVIMSSDEFRTGDPKERLIEQINCINCMGLQETNLILYNMKMDQSDIIYQLDLMKFDLIYSPYENDTHQDHRRCSQICQSVGRKRNITTMFYYCGSSIDFYPNLFSFIDIDKKDEMIKCFGSQIKSGAIHLDRRKKMEAYWASLISNDENSYAEGFKIRKMIYEI